MNVLYITLCQHNSHLFKNMDIELKAKIRTTLEKCWSPDTSVIFSESMPPSYGQCAQTAIVICEFFGGEILKTDGWHGQGRHFYNRINGERCDFTADQFTANPDYSHSIEYKDILSSPNEAENETNSIQISNLRYAFEIEWKKINSD